MQTGTGLLKHIVILLHIVGVRCHLGRIYNGLLQHHYKSHAAFNLVHLYTYQFGNQDSGIRVESIMHAGLARLVVVIEMSWADSLSDAVSQQVHFGITHPEYQLSKAPGVHGGHCQHKNNSCVPLNAHKCCPCSCVACVTCLRIWDVWVCGLYSAPKVFLEGVQPC